MSSQHLLNEIQQWRQDLAALSAPVLVLEDRVERGAPSSAAASPLTVNYCGGSGLGGSGSFQDLPPLPEFSSPGSAITSQQVQTPVAPGAVVLSEAERLAGFCGGTWVVTSEEEVVEIECGCLAVFTSWSGIYLEESTIPLRCIRISAPSNPKSNQEIALETLSSLGSQLFGKLRQQ